MVRVKIELTEQQLDNLVDVLEYVSSCEHENYVEHLEEGYNGNNHVYAKAVELMNLSWSKV